MTLSNLKNSPGSRKKPKRVGRGSGSGMGKTCGRGQKGQKSRSGGKPHPWFEGGQMPLQRRLPKRGFTNIFKKSYDLVNLKSLAELKVEGALTPQILKEKGLIRDLRAVKVLGDGDLTGAVEIHAHKFSQSALQKIEKSGGKAVVL
ncbi:MAG: 50S ribosomal protein L15 [Nitrospinota bacterium]|nr:50S ribosomal protein L15 [Nitrospinota bacterium]MDH5789590.1 50S ribosomal protein L15 [Nitrospinota bacterium]